MASPFTEVIIASMAQQFDPQAKAVADFMSSTTDKLKQDNELGKLDLISRVEKLIAEAKDKDNPSSAVLEAYERMLMRLTN